MLSDYSFHIASTPRCPSFDKCFLKLFRRISKIRLLIQLSDSIMYFCVQIPFKNGFKNKEGLLVQEGERSRSSCHQVKLGPGAHRVSSRLSLASFFPSVLQDISFIFKSHMLASSSCRLLTATTPNAGGELIPNHSREKGEILLAVPMEERTSYPGSSRPMSPLTSSDCLCDHHQTSSHHQREVMYSLAWNNGPLGSSCAVCPSSPQP